MSYQALARQFRPQNFTELVGQEHVSQALINGLEQNRIHHAFLFTGTRGVGKTTVARILAKALNCEKGVTGSPCGVCNACTEITEGRFIDLVEVDAASRTGVDDTRELLENVQYAPTKGRYKIYLIDEVHMFSNSSFNALLKTLEEPPEHVKFLLATTEPKKLPVTVLSRCLQFNLKRLSLTQIKNHLVKLLELQGLKFDDIAVELIARAADGSMRDGLSLLDQSLAFGAGKVVESDVKLMLGTMEQDTVVGLLNSIIAKDAQQLTNRLQQIFVMAPDYSRFLHDMAYLLHEVSLFQILNSYVESSQFDRATIKNIVAQSSPEQIQLFYQILVKGQDEINLAPDSKTGFEMTIIRMFAFKIGNPGSNSNSGKPATATTENIQVPKQSDSPPPQSTNQQAHKVASKKTSEVVTKKYQLADINTQNWDEIFAQLQLRGPARELARNAHIISNENSVLVLAIDKQAHAFITENAQNKLTSAIENISAEPISIKLEQDVEVAKTIAKVEQVKQDSDVRAVKDKVKQNQFVQNMQDNFDAEVIQIKQGESFI
ncbi:DNA polymerase III subunits gamma and tau [hydrothermal vent metagenome]|uniref:DNA-directed DNA polymerase n=1 Tax=hydrothermal vent metagenome TaxID=652676 RepID=A0A3B0W4B3_9ZZZZ